MCTSSGCPMRSSCYRYRAQPSRVQSYAFRSYGPGGCASFVRVEPTDLCRPLGVIDDEIDKRGEWNPPGAA
jgi:hypothetical protein